MSYSAYYVNLLEEEEASDGLVTVHCDTYDYPPTYVVWKRNGAAISVDGENYEALQVVTDWYNSRYHSEYLNTLIIRDVAGILEWAVYTCIVGNVEGNVSSSVEVDISESLKFALSDISTIAVDLHPDSAAMDYDLAYNKKFSLVCSGSSKPLHKIHFEDYTQVQWLNGTGSPVANENITISEISRRNAILYSTLSFLPLSSGHDQLYTCSMTVHIPTTNFFKYDESQYRLILGEL